MIHITEKHVPLAGGSAIADFGRDAYSQLEIELRLREPAELEFVVGEVRNNDGSVNRAPGGWRIVRVMKRACPAGESCFDFELPPHRSPYSCTKSVPLPPEAGGKPVAPFRYVEIVGGSGEALLRRKEFFGDFDDTAADFVSDCAELDRIWDFCKYTMKATGAFGIYIDGERERQPYEGDALSNQLGDLCCGGSAAAARRTIDWLLRNPTWFTEWRLVMPLMVRDYLLYTGDRPSVAAWLEALAKQVAYFVPAAAGLWHQGPERKAAPGEVPPIRDLIDWPIGERDGYEYGEVNLVPNCYLYAALGAMAELTGDAAHRERAERLRQAVCRAFRRADRFTDSPGSSHTALHSALYPAYFGLAELTDAMKEAILAKGMACSVYTAQFLLEFCFDHGLTDHAFDLLLSHDLRSYHNMLEKGATIAMEAWDDTLKPNQDWNHAWGAAPANVIPRCIAGIRPLEPGFRKFAVTPHPGPLREFRAKHPTPAGPVELEYRRGRCQLTVPEGATAVTKAGEFAAGRHEFKLDLSAKK